MAVRHRRWNTRMIDKVFKVFVAVNVLCQFCPCRTSVDMHGQAFIQTDSELRYVIDSGSASSFHFSSGQSVYEQSLSSVVRFDPPLLDFNEQPVGMPHTERVMVLNLDRHTGLHLLSISGSTSHFHCSFFQDKLVPPLGNTTFEVVFLARQVGAIENTLYIHSSKGSFKYQVSGVGINNPYRIRPFLGAKVPVNSSFSSVIHMYNPHGSVLQVEEIYTSGGDLHLELPTGEREASKELWEILPFETKVIMKASFVGRVESNHTAFIRIRTNKDDKQQMLIVPVEVEVTSEQGIFSMLEMLDFGLLRTIDDPAVLRLNVINSGSKPIHIENITVQPPNPAIRIDFRPIQLKPDIYSPTAIASVSFIASAIKSTRQCSGKIVVQSKNSQYRLIIPYQTTVLHGSLVYDRAQTLFYSGGSMTESQLNVVRDIYVTNTFNVTIVVYNISLALTSRHMFTIANFTHPCVLNPQQTTFLFNLTFHSNTSMLHFMTDVYLHTNTSVFKIPVYVYHGRLKVIHHRPEIFKGQLDFGTLAMGEKRVMNFTLRNDNPVDIVISKFSANMDGITVRLLGVESGNATTLSQSYDITETDINPLVLKPFHIAVFSVEVLAPDNEGTFSAEVIFNSQFEYLYIPITLRTAEGSLTLSEPDKLIWSKCFPSRIASSEVKIHSTFGWPLEARTVAFSPNDQRFYYVPVKNKPILMGPDQDTLIGHVYFDPRRDCRDDCYVSLPTHIPAGHTWLLGAVLDSEVTDTDQYLYTRYRQKWEELCSSQLNTVNVTVQLDTNQIRGFLFQAQAQLYWPSLTRRARVVFPLTQIGNSSIAEFVIENPADVPVVVQVLPLNVYPNVQTLLDMITPSLIPPEIGSDLVVVSDEGDDPDADVFTLPDLGENPAPMPPPPPGDTTSLIALRRSFETTLGVKPHRRTFAMLMPPRVKMSVRSKFQPKDDLLKTSLILVRNNLTIIDAVVVQGQGGFGELKFSNRKSGSQKPLTFELTEKQLKNCDKHTYTTSRNALSFTVKRTFTARNTGQLPIFIQSMRIDNSDCEGYGFKILDCSGFELQPNDSRKVDIMFTPDFTMSRVRQTLTLPTSLGTIPLNFTLQATIPPHMLSLCASTLPRPTWEPLLYYAAVLSMAFLLFCVLVAAYFEADRISMTELLRRRELSQGYDKSRVFDLRTISSSVRQSSVLSGELMERPKNGQIINGAGIVAPGSAGSTVKSRVLMGDHASNGNLTPPQPTQPAGCTVSKSKSPAGDQQRESSSSFRFLRRVFGSDTGRPSNGVGPDSAASSSSPAVKDVRPFAETSRAAESNGKGSRSTSQSLVRFAHIPFEVVGYVKAAVTAVWRVSVATLPRPGSSAKLAKEDASTTTSTSSGGGEIPFGNNFTCSAGVESHLTGPGKAATDTRTNTQPRKADKLALAGTAALDDTANSKSVGKNNKVKKVRTNDFRRVKEKLLLSEVEKASTAAAAAALTSSDKDDSSSTTTETSSIEADDNKIANTLDLIESLPTISSKVSKSTSNNKAATKPEPVTKLTHVTSEPALIQSSVTASSTAAATKTQDQFVPASTKTKGNKKAKLDGSLLKNNSSSIELPYTIKRGSADSSSVTSKDTSQPKQQASPPPSAIQNPIGNLQMPRKKVSKSKSSDCTGHMYNMSSRNEQNSPWVIPVPGSQQAADLGDIFAQTEAFAKLRTQPISPKDFAMAADTPRCMASTPPLSAVGAPVHLSSYSTDGAARAKSPDSFISAPKRANDVKLDRDSMLTVGRRSPGSHSVIGSTLMRPQPASRPIAAVGATVRRSWNHYSRDADSHLVSSPSAVAIGSDASLLSGGMIAGGGLGRNHMNVMSPAFVGPAPRLMPVSVSCDPLMPVNGSGYIHDLNLDPVMAGFHCANSVLPANDGIMDQCNPAMVDNQATIMHLLQADQRKRVYEYQQQRRRESDWPSFEPPPLMLSQADSVWERSSPSPPQALQKKWLGFQPMAVGQPTISGKGLNMQSPVQLSAASPWSSGVTGWNGATPDAANLNGGRNMYDAWSGNTDAAVRLTSPSVDASYGPDEDRNNLPVFDPFNSLGDMNSIWNPNNTDVSSSLRGWGGPRSDGSE